MPGGPARHPVGGHSLRVSFGTGAEDETALMSTDPVMNVNRDPAHVETNGSIIIDRRAPLTGLRHIGAGIAEWTNATPSEPWRIPYEEVLYVIEGELTVVAGDLTVVGRVGDVITAERGVEMVTRAVPGTRVFFASYPGNWKELLES